MVLYSAADLVFASRIKGTADGLGVPCRPVRSVEMLDARLGDSDVRALLLDLDAADRAWELLSHLRSLEEKGCLAERVRTLAWGPHVAVDLFRRARELGVGNVMARGAFVEALPELLVRLEAGGRV